MTTNTPGTNSRTSDGTESTTEHVFVVGGGPVGREVANRLAAAGTTVTVIDRAPLTDPPPNQTGCQVDSFDAVSLDAADFGDAAIAFLLEPDDATNLLVAQLAKTRFDVDRVFVLVNDPKRTPVYDTLDVETVHVPDAIARAAANRW